jgi:hydroxyethylthiazole kinase
MRAAIDGARSGAAGPVPWVLDPVAIGALPLRTSLAAEFVRRSPAVVRGNASEIAALAGGAGGRGVDSTAAPDQVAELAAELARTHGTVVAVSGAVDLLTDGTRTVRIVGGTPLLTRVTGVGCSLGAIIAGFCAVTPDRLVAAAAATALVCLAGERAVAQHPAPGSFAVGLLDQLSLVQPAEVGTVLLRRP